MCHKPHLAPRARYWCYTRLVRGLEGILSHKCIAETLCVRLSHAHARFTSPQQKMKSMRKNRSVSRPTA